MKIAITGTTSGIGAATAAALAAEGHELWLLNRNADKTAQQLANLKARYPNATTHGLVCDLNDLSSVQMAAAALQQLGGLDVLINNAGGLTPQRENTKDGFEAQFQMNHLGHFLLTNLLIDQLLATKGKVINLSSEAHRAARLNLEDLQMEQGWSTFSAYANAKGCNILFTKGLHARFNQQGLQAFAVHPGVVNTHFGDGLGGMKWMWQLMTPFLISPAKGAKTSVHLATASQHLVSGAYYKNSKVNKPAGYVHTAELIDGLWKHSTVMVEQYLGM
jgi:NAD(P)-dependent dehydrogenase (short-subunit alcohol dehydrogenase family)